MGIPILLFRLEGVLQSWGEHSKWDYRDSADFPSKSGVVGLIGCALGLERNDTRLGEISRKLHMIVRADKPGELISDFHTVSAEVLYNAEGKPRGGGSTVITHRSYLQDASFLVGLTGDVTLLEEIEATLQNPRWTVYLGRKSCVPTVPIIGTVTTEYDSLLQAMEKYPVRKCRRNGKVQQESPLLVEMESEGMEGRQRPDERSGEPGLHYQNRRVVVRRIVKQEGNDVSE